MLEEFIYVLFLHFIFEIFTKNYTKTKLVVMLTDVITLTAECPLLIYCIYSFYSLSLSLSESCSPSSRDYYSTNHGVGLRLYFPRGLAWHPDHPVSPSFLRLDFYDRSLYFSLKDNFFYLSKVVYKYIHFCPFKFTQKIQKLRIKF